jgi:Domain of unknown function (DUF4338)/Transposase DNA-binding/Transposase Tn5 dimerisation domain
MNICGQHFSSSIAARIQQTVCQDPALSRLALSRQICEWLDWRSPNGRLKDMSCRKALLKMQKMGIIALPGAQKRVGFEHKVTDQMAPPVTPQLNCSLANLGEVSVYPVSSRYAQESKIWSALLEHYHRLGSGPICGSQIRYLIKSNRGYLGALSFSSATFALACRDRYIGWTEGARRANLERVVCNSRFLILPDLKVPNLASHVLSLALSRLPVDWQQRYHTCPLLIETFVSPDFDGTCYKAANFTYVGESAGRRDGKPKQVFLYPLSKGWQKVLCAEPDIPLPRLEAPRNWAEEELGTIRLYDERLKKRLYTLAQDFYNSPQANIPEACGSKAGMWGAYRFFKNPKVTMDIILNAHTEATIERIKQQGVVLCPQDTTTLNYTTHTMTDGLGPISKAENSLGLLLHDTLAFTEKGTPLGILQAQCWARDPEQMGKKYSRQELTIEQKESVKWLKSFRKVSQIQNACPDTLLVSIGDREADIYELFREATQKGAPKLLVRATKSRQRKVEEKYLWDYMASQEIMVSHQIHVPRHGSHFDRDTWLDIRFAQVTLQPPKGYTTPITMWAVYATEHPKFVPDKAKPIEWLLLTTVEVKSAEDAIEKLNWYTKRWGIEVYHKTLKSGCRIEDRQLEEVDRLEVCLGLDMVVAWRVDYLKMLGREKPDEPCTIFFKDVEWKALHCLVNNTTVLPATTPTIRQTVFMVASQGGHLGRKCDGFPGAQTIWRGLMKLYTAAKMYALFTQQHYPDPMHSGP